MVSEREAREARRKAEMERGAAVIAPLVAKQQTEDAFTALRLRFSPAHADQTEATDRRRRQEHRERDLQHLPNNRDGTPRRG